jgi:uncharacterized membrane protein YcjF (UPF0283 family)
VGEALERAVMRSVRIDFVEPRAGKFIWAVAALVVFAIVVITGAKVWQLRQHRVVLEQQQAALQAQQLQRLAQAQPAVPPKGNQRAVSEAAAQRLLRRDWNRLYDAIETPALAKVRLLQLTMDAGTGLVVLEYELESMAQATVVTRALSDASGQAGVWRLERVDKTSQGGVVETDRFRAVLQGEIE